MSVKRGTAKVVYTVALRILLPMMKAKLLEAQLPGWINGPLWERQMKPIPTMFRHSLEVSEKPKSLSQIGGKKGLPNGWTLHNECRQGSE